MQQMSRQEGGLLQGRKYSGGCRAVKTLQEAQEALRPAEGTSPGILEGSSTQPLEALRLRKAWRLS